MSSLVNTTKVVNEKHGLAVLISGRGSNLFNLIAKCNSSVYPGKIECVISNNPNAEGLKKPQENGIPVFFIGTQNYESELNNILSKFNIKVICLAGFMRVLSREFVRLWQGKIINIHPSLLPSFKGLHAQKQALEAGVKITGCTVHYVDEKLDNGKIIMQEAVPVLRNDDVESLSARILTAEHKCYPLAIQSILNP